MRSSAYPKNYIRFAGNFRRRSWELKSSKPLLCCRIDGRWTIDQRSSYRPVVCPLSEISPVHAAPASSPPEIDLSILPMLPPVLPGCTCATQGIESTQKAKLTPRAQHEIVVISLR